MASLKRELADMMAWVARAELELVSERFEATQALTDVIHPMRILIVLCDERSVSRRKLR
jgi:hypothetical protein